jgi:hypothetical protein
MYHTDELISEIIGLLIGIAIFIVGIRTSRKRQRLINNGRRVKAAIYDIEQGDGDALYYPVIRFITVNDEWITKRYYKGRPYGSYIKGKLVTVIYNKTHPENFVIDDMQLQLTGSILTVIGVITIVLSIAFGVFYVMIS